MDVIWSNRLRLQPIHRGWWQAAELFAHSGDSWYWLIGLVLVWLVGSPDWRKLAVILAASLTIEAVFVLAIKFSVRRARPEGDWGAIYRSTDPHSFPSGHAARAFLIALMSVQLGPAWFAIVLWLWAPLVCLARVALGVHYLSDVVVGMIIGLISALVLLKLLPLMLAVISTLLPFLL